MFISIFCTLYFVLSQKSADILLGMLKCLIRAILKTVKDNETAEYIARHILNNSRTVRTRFRLDRLSTVYTVRKWGIWDRVESVKSPCTEQVQKHKKRVHREPRNSRRAVTCSNTSAFETRREGKNSHRGNTRDDITKGRGYVTGCESQN